MKLWFVSFLILFFGAEALQWFAQVHWFGGVELSIPAVVIGGVGLAIASNYRQFQALGLLPELWSDAPLPSPVAEKRPPSPPPIATDSEVSQPAAEPAAKPEKSISFEIPKPRSISFEIRKSPKR